MKRSPINESFSVNASLAGAAGRRAAVSKTGERNPYAENDALSIQWQYGWDKGCAQLCKLAVEQFPLPATITQELYDSASGLIDTEGICDSFKLAALLGVDISTGIQLNTLHLHRAMAANPYPVRSGLVPVTDDFCIHLVPSGFGDHGGKVLGDT